MLVDISGTLALPPCTISPQGKGGEGKGEKGLGGGRHSALYGSQTWTKVPDSVFFRVATLVEIFAVSVLCCAQHSTVCAQIKKTPFP